MQIHRYKKWYGNSKISMFSWTKNLIFRKKNFSEFLGCVRDRTQVTKTMVHSKLESPKDWSSILNNALETTWTVFFLQIINTKSIKLLSFGKRFQRWLFLKLEFSNYVIFKPVWKKSSKETEKIFCESSTKLCRQKNKKLNANFF